MGEKSIDGRILLFSTALVNRFLGYYTPWRQAFLGYREAPIILLFYGSPGTFGELKATAKRAFHSFSSKGVRLDLLFRAEK
jgi:hypothetical protein